MRTGKKIGEGSYGVVCHATYRGSKVVVKVMKPRNTLAEFAHEVDMSMRLTHPCIIETLGWSWNGHEAALVMGRADGSALSFQKEGRLDSLVAKLRLLLHLAAGLNHMHEYRLVHRDIAMRNILVREHVSGGHWYQGLLADFGLTRELPEDLEGVPSSESPPGPVHWMAPESLLKGAYSRASDTYMFAMTAVELFTGRIPFDGMKREQMIPFVLGGGRPPRMPVDVCPAELSDLLAACWDADPSRRPKMDEVVLRLEKMVAERRPDAAVPRPAAAGQPSVPEPTRTAGTELKVVAEAWQRPAAPGQVVSTMLRVGARLTVYRDPGTGELWCPTLSPEGAPVQVPVDIVDRPRGAPVEAAPRAIAPPRADGDPRIPRGERFCSTCGDRRMRLEDRKCTTCGKPFGALEMLSV